MRCLSCRGDSPLNPEFGCVTGICCTCFLIRSFVVRLNYSLHAFLHLPILQGEYIILSAFDKNADPDVMDHSLLNLIYYTLVEIVP
ncbi:hypothetical protein Tsubulata_048690 [Turnera subulata]|uniref:THH1/TOM1/TOM3 domain-containing protein n=1 Tax=Turnera subulata TaxID=218843 RepID=A0A9Q0FQS9_9ROSI|nr:hypothetical protein Tsubulata_048690 [Turnera subulata]